MLDKDEEFTTKLLGLMQQASPSMIRLRVNGQMIHIEATTGKVTDIPVALFYRMSIPDILKLVGVKADDTNLKKWS